MNSVRTARPATKAKNKRVASSNKRVRKAVVPSSYYWWPITRSKIKQAALKIAKEIEPEKIILFGSFAYGKPTPDSDVDLLVIMESDERPAKRATAIYLVLSGKTFPMDILVRTPAELSHRLAIGDFFIKEIMERGKVVYDRRVT